MHDVEPPGLQLGRAAAAAAHVDDVDFQSLRGVEAGVACHVPGQHGIDRIGDAGLELNRLLRRRRLPCDDDESEDGAADACGTTTSCGLHRRFLPFSLCPS
jgi:hypothetical protein